MKKSVSSAIFAVAVTLVVLVLKSKSSLRVEQLASWHLVARTNIMPRSTLSAVVEEELLKLQYPANCSQRKTLYCDMKTKMYIGFGSYFHHLVHCLALAYATGRTFQLDRLEWPFGPMGWNGVFKQLSNCPYKPKQTRNAVHFGKDGWEYAESVELLVPEKPFGTLPFRASAVPEKWLNEMKNIHWNPELFWTGQLASFLWQFHPYFWGNLTEVLKIAQQLESWRPIVGVHIRRTDKKSEANYFEVKDYFYKVEQYYETLTQRNITFERKRIYLATDEPQVLKEIRNSYPDYDVLYYVNNPYCGKTDCRLNVDSAIAIYIDIEMLSRCDFVVCTLSSNVGRLVYELQQTRQLPSNNQKISNRLNSLDCSWYIDFHTVQMFIVKTNYTAQQPDELNLYENQLIKSEGDPCPRKIRRARRYIKGTLKSNLSGKFVDYKGLFPLNVVEDYAQHYVGTL